LGHFCFAYFLLFLGRGSLEKPYLSIIIPAYREEDRIIAALKAINEHYYNTGLKYEVIVIEDGARDRTGELVLKFSANNPHVRLLTNEKNLGKGGAVKRGMLAAAGEYMLFADADMSTPIGEAERLLPFFSEGFDVVIASRRVKGAKISVFQPPLRRLAGWFFHNIRRMIILPRIKDTQCGFKCFTAAAAREIFSRSQINGFVFDVEALAIARGLGYRIKEVPVKWIDDRRTTLSAAKHAWNIFIDLLKVKYRSLSGKYSFRKRKI